jgi:hypothetical protein
MKKVSLALFISLLSMAGFASAQSTSAGASSSEGVTMSTDPSKAAAVESRAKELAQSTPSSTESTSGASGEKKATKKKAKKSAKAKKA